ncbi:MAG: secretin and TonB N-terminal domain-containing protein [Chlamydiota bacterium]
MSANKWATLCCALCAGALVLSSAIAQEAAPPVPPSPQAGGETSGLISLNVRDAEIHEVLATFSKRFNIPIIAGPEIEGRVTVMIADVPWETALGQVLDACNLSYVEEGDVIRVVKKGGAAPVPAQAAQAVPAEANPSSAPVQVGAVPVEVAPSSAPVQVGAVPFEANPSLVPAQAAAATTPAAGAIREELPGPPPSSPALSGAATPTPLAVVGVKTVATPVGTPASGKVTFDFKDADLVNILRIFSMRYGINIIAGPEVKGKVTIRLMDVPWETALKLILDSNNYSYVKQQNVFRILSRDQLDKEPMETKVFPLSYAQAKDVANSITHLLTPQRGQLKPDDRSNTIVITDIPKKLSDIEEVIYRLDRRTPQVLIEARILELKDDFDENIGINWVALKGYNVSIGPPKGEGLWGIAREETRAREDSSADIFQNILTEQDSKTKTKTATDTSSTLIPGGTTISTTNDNTAVDQNSTTRNTTDGVTGIDGTIGGEGGKLLPLGSLTSHPYGVNQGGSKVVTTELTQAVLTPDNFQLTLNFLQEQTDANLISHPKIVTADNKDSVMKVADQWPIPNFQFNNDTGQWEISNFQYKDIGIILKVRPHVNEDEYINLKVVPEVSNILSFTTFGGATSAQLPIISTRTAETDVLIRNGQTLAIGGLMREDESDTVNKVPLLGEIPLVGPYLFAYSSKKLRNSNILIFVTANVVTEENKDMLWIGQREEQNRQLNIPKMKWWEPKKLRHGLGSVPGY